MPLKPPTTEVSPRSTAVAQKPLQADAVLPSGWELPHFSATATRPVTLRYRHRPGRKLQMEVECQSQRVPLPDTVGAGGETWTLRANCETKEVDERGNAVISLTITHMKRTIPPPFPEFDSERHMGTKAPRLRHYAAVLNQPLVMIVTPTGRIPDFCWRPLEDVKRRLGMDPADRRESVESSELLALVGDLVLPAFVWLPEEPVTTGAAIPAEDHYLWVEGDNDVFTERLRRLSAVSADNKEAVLETVAGQSRRGTRKGYVEVTLERVYGTEWLLFDLDGGRVARNFQHWEVVTSSAAGAQATQVKSSRLLRFRCTEVPD